MWLTCKVINMHGNYYYMVEGGPHVHGNNYYIWWRGALTCGN